MIQHALTPYSQTVLIPAGTFLMGSDFGEEDEQPVHEVTLDAFHIDDRPITNQQFKTFLKARPDWQKRPIIKRYLNPYYLYLWRQEIIFPQGKRNHPVVYVNWYSAAAYCNWRSREEGFVPCYEEGNGFACDFSASGYRLPTEAEYEYAARGGIAQAHYPWGNNIDKSLANYDNLIGDTTEVAIYQPNGYSLYDMTGNVRHWCQDWYQPHAYTESVMSNPRIVQTVTHKIYRGGAWGTPADMQRCASRFWILPVNCNPDFSFRCVRRG